MKIPFSTNNFSAEFKASLGFVDIDIPYVKIYSDLLQACIYIQDTIGKDTYDALILNYEKSPEAGSEEEKQDELLNHLFKYAIAVKAYNLFAPSTDLAHTPNGRRMRSSDDEKTPFEWMIAKDDDNLQRRTYKAIDALINYMDGSFSNWKNSEVYKNTYNLFVRNTKDFSSAFQIDSTLLYYKLIPGLLQCQNREIAPRIGLDFMKNLIDKRHYFSYNPSGDEKEALTENEKLIIDYIKEASSYYALSWGILRLQINMFPEGITQSINSEQRVIKASKVPEVPIIDQISKIYRSDCNIILSKIEQLVLKINPPILQNLTEEELKEKKYGFTEDDFFATT